MNNIHGEGMFRPDEEEFFEAIEKALGFKLFVWQKTFITTGAFRRYGETTAKVLRELLQYDVQPIDFTLPAHSAREKIYRAELLEIKRKLNENGIRTREVFTSRKEKDAWQREARKSAARENPDGFRASVFMNESFLRRENEQWQIKYFWR